MVYAQVQVLSSDDDGVGHFGRVDDTGKDSTSDRDVTGEGALLVDVSTVDGLCAGLAVVLTVSTSVSALIPLRAGSFLAKQSAILLQYTT